MRLEAEHFLSIGFTVGAVVCCFLFLYGDQSHKAYQALSAIVQALLAIAWKPSKVPDNIYLNSAKSARQAKFHR